jgi:polygalacturonase
LNFSNPSNNFVGTGSGLSNLDASHLALGTVPDARLAANIARTNQLVGMTQWISVKDYGATGNGTTDDSSAIKNAMQAVYAARAVDHSTATGGISDH